MRLLNIIFFSYFSFLQPGAKSRTYYKMGKIIKVEHTTAKNRGHDWHMRQRSDSGIFRKASLDYLIPLYLAIQLEVTVKVK